MTREDKDKMRDDIRATLEALFDKHLLSSMVVGYVDRSPGMSSHCVELLGSGPECIGLAEIVKRTSVNALLYGADTEEDGDED